MISACSVAALASGVLLALSFPRYGHPAVAFIGNQRRRTGFGNQEIGPGNTHFGTEKMLAQHLARLASQCRNIGRRARLKRPPQAKAVGNCVRAATLDRKQSGGRANLADGRTLRFTGVPLGTSELARPW